jgi:organic radical activating enzyme
MLSKKLIVQHADVAAKVSDYANLKSNELLVTTWFHTLQGEGPLAGRPAYFLRLAGCNYGAKRSFCRGCDTNFALKNGKVMAFEEIEASVFENVSDELSSNLELEAILVITGGEPCLQPSLPAFIRWLKEKHPLLTIQLETNGVFVETIVKCSREGAIVVCSPKSSAKGYQNKGFLDIPDFVTNNEPSTFCKFVVSADPDDPHHYLPEWFNQIHNRQDRVFISPLTVYKKAYEGEVSSAWNPNLVDQEATSHNYQYAAELCMKHGCRLSVQLHTLTNLP